MPDPIEVELIADPKDLPFAPDPKEELLYYMEETGGQLPVQTRAILKLMTHPDVLPYAQKYFGGIDPDSKCLKYGDPWDCIQEAEAKYETIHYEWMGGLWRDPNWEGPMCGNCVAKVKRREPERNV